MKDSDQSGWWTPERRDLLAWFKEKAESLGELYEGAVRMACDVGYPGRTRFVSHAVREIRNRLPDVIAGPRKGRRLVYVNRLDGIVKKWEREGIPLDGSVPSGGVTEGAPRDPRKVVVSRGAYLAMAKLVRDHAASRETVRDAAARLYRAVDPRNSETEAWLRPRVDQWLAVTEWFVKRAHDRSRTDRDNGGEELMERFEAFETALRALVSEFFKTTEKLDEVLDDANS